MMQKVKTFFVESKQEFDKVDWPTSDETVQYTIVVIGISLALAAYLGLLDYIFLEFLGMLL